MTRNPELGLVGRADGSIALRHRDGKYVCQDYRGYPVVLLTVREDAPLVMGFTPEGAEAFVLGYHLGKEQARAEA